MKGGKFAETSFDDDCKITFDDNVDLVVDHIGDRRASYASDQLRWGRRRMWRRSTRSGRTVWLSWTPPT